MGKKLIPPIDAATVAAVIGASIEHKRGLTAKQLVEHDGNMTRKLTDYYRSKDDAGGTMLAVLMEAQAMLHQTRNSDGLHARVTNAINNAKEAGFRCPTP